MPRTWIAPTVAALLAIPTVADARGDRFLHEPPDVEKTAAYRYATLDDDDCLKQLKARNFPFQRAEPTKGVETPIRFTGPIHGVTFHTSYPPREDTPAAIADCRLALAVDDLATVLHAHDVVEAQYYSMYRRRGLGVIKPKRRHPAGRAIDLVTIKLKDGTTYSIQYDFHGRPGQQTCGEKAAKPTKDTPGARLWRDIVCQMADKGSFNLILTPHYDWGHRDHLHMEVRSDIRWFLVH